MTAHPSAALYPGGKPFPVLAACEHFAGSEKTMRKALAMQSTMGPVFDLTCDCEDGAAAGHEREHAQMVATVINCADNRFGRVGARVHDLTHPHWRDDLDIIIGQAGEHAAYLVLPKVESVDGVLTMISAVHQACAVHGITREIPLHVLIETHGALREVQRIAALPGVETLDFGLMDFIAAHHGAIPSSAMHSPGQFTHPLIVRAKCEIAAAALGNGVVPAHNVTTELRDTQVIFNDARHARAEFGYLRMWSIHPAQIQPIIDAMRPDFAEVETATAILVAASAADWGPIQHEGQLHDRATYRYYWQLLQRAKATGVSLPAAAQIFYAGITT